MPEPLLQVEAVSLALPDLAAKAAFGRAPLRTILHAIDMQVAAGECVALVGESGSGKSVSALSIMRLLPRHTGRIPQGRIIFDGRNLLDLDEEQMREIRGRDISDRKSTRLNSSHGGISRMPSSA